jgi:hypothetical protein
VTLAFPVSLTDLGTAVLDRACSSAGVFSGRKTHRERDAPNCACVGLPVTPRDDDWHRNNIEALSRIQTEARPRPSCEPTSPPTIRVSASA